jgi:hypothetical protein
MVILGVEPHRDPLPYADLFFDPEDGGDTILRNVGCNSTDYTASYHRR